MNKKRKKRKGELTAKVGENRDAQNCDSQDLTDEIKRGKCYKISVSSGIPKSGKRAANLKVEWTADGVEGSVGLQVGDETRCLKKITKLTVHCNEGRSVTYSLVECKCP